MNTQDFKRKLTAIFSADVAGYSRLMGEDEAATVKTLEAYKQVMFSLIKQHRGRVIDSPGDNLLAEFASVVDAVQCGVAVQKELQARNADLPENRKMQFRIGINLGDVIEEQERIYGDGVNIAARLEALADPGGICISKTAFDQIETKLPLGYEYLGEQTVKNITKPVGAYRVVLEPRITVVGGAKKKDLSRQRRVPLAIAVIVILLVGVLALWQFVLRPSPPSVEKADPKKMAYPLPDRPSVAVLPFANMSDDSKQEYLADGITENIISALSQVPNIFVIARNSTFTYKGKPVKVQQVAEELGVRYVLEGSVQKSGDTLRITAQLIDAITGHHVWSERYDRELKKIFALQDEVTMKVIKALQVKLTVGDTARHVAKGTENLEAYLKTLQALESHYTQTKEGYAQSKRLLEEVIALDPQFPQAYGVMAINHAMEAQQGFSKSREESLKQALELTKKAIAMDDSNALFHVNLAWLLSLGRKYDNAFAECERALDLAPNSAVAHIWMANVLRKVGRPEEAVPYAEQALRLNPFGPAWWYRELGLAHFGAGRYEEAIAWHKKSLNRNPKDILTHIALTTAYSWAGRHEDARAQAAEVLRINPSVSMEERAESFAYKNQVDLDRFLDGLRKAGLPDKPPLPLPDKPSIAVLPFVNMSDDPQQEYFSDGMTEDLITDLSKISGLFVTARNSTFVYKGKPVKVRQVAEELGVRYVIEGSVRRSDEKLRINVQLIDATTGHHLWAERYDGSRKDVFALQDKINQKIVAALAVKLTEGEKVQVAQKWTNKPAAYDEYLKGREHTSRLTADDYDKAEACYKRALDLDPKFTQARAALASLCLTRAQFGLGKMGTTVYLHNRLWAVHHLREAMREPTSLAYRLSGDMDLLMRKHDAAISQIEKALSLDPNDPYIHGSLSWALCMAGRPEEAMEHAKRAMRLDPINPDRYLYNIGVAQFCLGNMEEAATLLEKVVKVNPEHTVSAGPLAAAYAHLGRNEEARAAYENLRKDLQYIMLYLPGVMYHYPFKDRRVADSFAEGLIKAGMPGGLSDYIHVSKEDQITGDDLRALYYPSVITGFLFGAQWSADFAKDGRVAFRSVYLGEVDTGKSWLEDDKVCFQPQRHWGMVYCGTTFKNPRGTFEGKNEYVLFEDLGSKPFSRAR